MAVGIDEYRSMLRSPVYGLWSGRADIKWFLDAMGDAVYSGLKGAWEAGAAKAGIAPDEMTDEELSRMQTDIYEQFTYIGRFGDYILAHSKAEGGKLESLNMRFEMWVARYNEFFTRGYMMAKSNQKMKWHLGNTKEHCGSCAKLSGKVKRASTWIKADIYPQHPDLECNGYQCKCRLESTDEPLTKGRLPSIP